MEKIHDPLVIKSITIKNRIGMPAMCMYTADNDGLANQWHLVHYGSRAAAGVGLIIQEASAVAPEGRITPFDIGLWNDGQIAFLKQITAFITEQGCIPGIQLAHAGRKASTAHPRYKGIQLRAGNGGWKTLGPSAIPLRTTEDPPLEMSTAQILSVVNAFRSAAERSLKAGYKIVEIHAAHGYLIHQFLSPLSNTRSDQYGGSFENRIRLIIQIVEAVKTVWPDNLPLLVRLSATDWTEGGWNLEETIKLSSILKEKGVDLIDVSSGGNVAKAKIPSAPLYQVPFAEAVRKTGILTSAVGQITKPEEANSILEKKQADIVFIGRELLRNPYFMLQAGSEYPEQYLRGKLS